MDQVALKREFVRFAEKGDIPFAELCRRFGVSRTNGYKTLRRHRAEGEAGLAPRSRRPKNTPKRLRAGVEERIVALRKEHPAWGARKIRKLLEREGTVPLPAASTVTAVINRCGLASPQRSGASRPFVRFESPVPNALWQMDFKGWHETLSGPCHPLTVLDDCSRYNLCLAALPNERAEGVRRELEKTFRRYGVPDAMLMDNGAPWGTDSERQHTVLTTWLMRLGVKVLHSRPYHPQTNGKDERFHRTLKEELITTRQWRDLAHCQKEFDRWRAVYNEERPHEAISLDTPASRYGASLRPFPQSLLDPCYPAGTPTRTVSINGRISFRGQSHYVGKAFQRLLVRIVEAARPGRFDVFFMRNRIAQLHTNNEPDCVTDVHGTLSSMSPV
jgi:transposase InsO family protein